MIIAEQLYVIQMNMITAVCDNTAVYDNRRA